jgi:hypothetical protein
VLGGRFAEILPHLSARPMTYLKTCKIGEALETVGLMLGSNKSRGYCLEMICADFLAGANMEGTNPEALVLSLRRVYELLPHEQQCQFLYEITSSSCRD